jgi:hypothetical protein
VILLRTSPDTIDEPALLDVVSSNAGLEPMLYEYKREVGNGASVLEAIASMANNVGGLVLVGVDETLPDADRLVGVPPAQKDRLKDMCIARLVPPYCPEIVAVPVGTGGNIVLAMFINPDDARRPVMYENKVLIRTTGGKYPADWYRLRELFREEQIGDDGASGFGRSLVQMPLYSVEDPMPDLAFRLAVRLRGATGSRARITESGRNGVLQTIRRSDAPLTGTNGALAQIAMYLMPSSGQIGWRLEGENHSTRMTIAWALLQGDFRPVEARLQLELPQPHAARPSIVVQLDAFVREGNPPRKLGLLETHAVIGEMISLLWGPVGDSISKSMLGVPLGIPAEAELSIASPHNSGNGQRRPIQEVVDFSVARWIPGTNGAFGATVPLRFDASHRDIAAVHALALDCLEELGTTAGLDGVRSVVQQLLSS